MFRDLFLQRGLPVPAVSLGLALSCGVISLAEWIAPELSKVLGGGVGVHMHCWQVVTARFAHGGDFLGPHLATNGAIFVLFGTLLERLLGSGRFFAVSCAMFLTETLLRWGLHRWGNGASGLCWGYLAFMVPLGIWSWRLLGTKLFRDPWGLLAIGLGGFMVVGVPLVEMGRESTTALIHGLSVATALPFAVGWKRILHENLRKTLAHTPRDPERGALRALALGATAMLVLFNAAVTVGAGAGILLPSDDGRGPRVVAVAPRERTREALNAQGGKIVLSFDRPMDRRLYSRTISVDPPAGEATLELLCAWPSADTLVMTCSRPLSPEERLQVSLLVRGEAGGWGAHPVDLVFGGAPGETP